MILFKNVRYKNFLSSGNVFTDIQLDRAKTTLITGENGAGKSTMLDAITFGLFGKPFRKINKPQLVNSINEKACVVEVVFMIGKKSILVRRGIKPNIFEIEVDGQQLQQDANIRDFQEYLEKQILKLNYKSFTQIIILGNSSFVPFMQLKAQDRRAIIEDLLDIQIFSNMGNILKTYSAENKLKLDENRSSKNLIENKINLKEDYIIQLKNKTKNLVSKFEKDINKNLSQKESILKEMAEANKDVEELLGQVEDAKQIAEKHDKLTEYQRSILGTLIPSRKVSPSLSQMMTVRHVNRTSITLSSTKRLAKSKKRSRNMRMLLKKLTNNWAMLEQDFQQYSRYKKTYSLSRPKHNRSIIV